MKDNLIRYSSVLMLIVTLIVMGCTKTQDKSAPAEPLRTPEETLKQFIEISSSAKGLKDKERLQNLCIGELRRAFDRMSNEVFEISYLNTKITIKDLKILETQTAEKSAKIRYQIEVTNAQGTDTTHEVNEREMELAQSQGNWFIEAIRTSGTDKVAFTEGMIL